jgi:hypothetical protein
MSFLPGQKPLVFQPAVTSNIRAADSMSYGHCGNNPCEPLPVFNELAATRGMATETARTGYVPFAQTGW